MMKNKLLIIALAFICMLLVGCSRTYKVTFYIDGTNADSQIIKSGETIENFVPTKVGYTFICWTLDDEEFDVNTPINNNISLYASWEANEIKLTYHINDKVNEVIVEAGSIIKKPADPVVEGYIFLGWKDKDNKDFAFNTTSDVDVEIYANMVKDSEYKPSLTVFFNSTGAKITYDSIKVKRLDTFKDLPTPTYEGHDFLGWYLNNVKVENGDVIKETSDFTLIAKWEEHKITYEISFNTNGGNAINNMVVSPNEEVNLPSPTRTGCEFLGWYLNGRKVENGFVYEYEEAIILKANWKVTTEVALKLNGNNLTYKDTKANVMVPTEYVSNINEMRAVWVTSYVGDFSPSANKQTMMANLTKVLDKMEEYNMNCIVFHLRTTNNAYYKTKLAPINSSYGTYESFEEWDYLTWFIDECHKRGIEFHAWLNPYRIASSGYSLTAKASDVAADYANYPDNPASDASNILMTYPSSTSQGAILNPCKKAVQDYLIDVCKELVNNYDIDAIHFDDYFYAQLSAANLILHEADQADYESYIKVTPGCTYNKTSATDKADFRRNSVTSLIKGIHKMLLSHYEKKGKYVQLGISPTGVYKNGDGVVTYDNNGIAITTGSATSGYAHYGNPLYADTLLWANLGYIDYLIPQNYVSSDTSAAKFHDEVKWWAEALKNVRCKLYLGLSIYKSFDSNTLAWATNEDELINQLLVGKHYSKVEGYCFFSYKQILAIEKNKNIAYNAMRLFDNRTIKEGKAMIYYLYYGITALMFTLFFLIGRSKIKCFKTILKVLAILTFSLFMFRYLIKIANLFYIDHLDLTKGLESVGEILIGEFFIIFHYSTMLLIALYPFFEGKIHKFILMITGGITSLLDPVHFKTIFVAFTGVNETGKPLLSDILISIEAGLILSFTILAIVENIKTKLDKKEIIGVVFGTLGCLIAAVPNYIFVNIFDQSRNIYPALDLNLFHRFYLYGAILMPLTVYFVLKDKTEDTKRCFLIYYSVMSVVNYLFWHNFGSVNDLCSWPLHLCNTALFITPLCIIFRLKKVFYFTYFINVFGAVCAMATPNYKDYLTFFNYEIVCFYREHWQVFGMPIVVVALGLFPRPKLKEFLYSLLWFGIYFFGILFINAWFSNYQVTDYFFVNSDFIADKFGNAILDLRSNNTWTFSVKEGILKLPWLNLDFNGGNISIGQRSLESGMLTFTFYPIYQILFFSVYIAVSFAMWFLYELAYDVVDNTIDMNRRSKIIKLERLEFIKELNGKEIDKPIHMENDNKLIVKNFTKRYGKSDVYAVKDANIEVHGGEIFGFLGPNGAGKSTIIKSIVGIQAFDGGSIEVCGYDNVKQAKIAKSLIGFVPDHYALYEKLTAREFINYIADLYNVSQEDRDERLNKYLDRFDFHQAIDNKMRTYSHGMKQKVTIMAALIHNPKVWILDEPLTGLDPNSIFQVKECIKEHAAAGNIVFFSSHIIDVVERICDKITIINHGQIQCVADVHELEEKGIVLEDYYMNVINNKNVESIKVKE